MTRRPRDTRPRTASPARVPAARGRLIAFAVPASIVAIGAIAYLGSLSGPFIFDDLRHIVDNARVHRLWPITDVLAGTSRPLLMLTLAVNHALGGLNVRGYRLVNLAFHMLAALT